jgi:hypothetical protein
MVRHKKLSIGEFIETTDAEVYLMIKSFAGHPDPVLSFLASSFVSRRFPQCILDSARSKSTLSNKYYINDGADGLDSNRYQDFKVIIEDLTAFVAERMARQDLPAGAAPYLVTYDPADFESSPPTDLLFSFGKDIVTFPEIDAQCVGFDVNSLLDTFVIHRIFVPRGFGTAAEERLAEKYGIMPHESGGADA